MHQTAVARVCREVSAQCVRSRAKHLPVQRADGLGHRTARHVLLGEAEVDQDHHRVVGLGLEPSKATWRGVVTASRSGAAWKRGGDARVSTVSAVRVVVIGHKKKRGVAKWSTENGCVATRHVAATLRPPASSITGTAISPPQKKPPAKRNQQLQRNIALHDVLELEVAVADVLLVEVAHRGRDLVRVDRRLALRVRHALIPAPLPTKRQAQGAGDVHRKRGKAALGVTNDKVQVSRGLFVRKEKAERALAPRLAAQRSSGISDSEEKRKRAVQVPAAAVLHDEVHLPLALKQLEGRDYVRVVQLHEEVDFIAQFLAHLAAHAVHLDRL